MVCTVGARHIQYIHAREGRFWRADSSVVHIPVQDVVHSLLAARGAAGPTLWMTVGSVENRPVE